jgi:transmembrane sensor
MASLISEDIRREAEAWFARRREPAVREAEHEAFERWRASDEAHAHAYADTEQLWDQLAVLQHSEKLQALATKLVTDSPEAAPRRNRIIPFSLAASVVAVAMLVALWYPGGPEVRKYATALGEQRTETLADGTTLRLNTLSSLEVRMSRSQRDIKLTRGEANFDVAKDATRPFVVAAGDGTVTALGTQFQVRREGKQVAVTLIEGSVQLARPARREVESLEPGQQATFSEDASGIVRRNVNVKALTSWMSGRLEFRSTPLEEAVAEINRYSGRKLRIGDSAINRIEVSGTFRTGDIDGAAAAFEAAFPVRGEMHETEIVLLPQGK